MDGLKVYTGKETLQVLMEGKVIKANGLSYRFVDDLQVDFGEGKGWEESQLKVNSLLRFKATEVVTPQVGDWVRVYTYSDTYVGKITRMDDTKMYADWEGEGVGLYLDGSTNGWEILTPEQVSEYKRKQAFVKVGRKLNEFKDDDIALINSTSEVAIVVSNNNDESVRLHVLNQGGKGYTAKPHQLTPIYFKDNQVSL